MALLPRLSWPRPRMAAGPRAVSLQIDTDPHTTAIPSLMSADRQIGHIEALRGSRASALQLVTLFRSVTLLSSTIAGAMANTLHVVDRHRRELKSQPERTLSLLTESPNGFTPATTFYEDAMTDLLMTGNSLVGIERINSEPSRLRRLSPGDATMHRTRGGGIYYKARLADWPSGRGETIELGAADVVHARWPDLLGRTAAAGDSRGREGFATAPLTILAGALNLSAEVERWIAQYFNSASGGARADVAVIYPDPMEETEQKEVAASIIDSIRSRNPLLLFADPKIVPIKSTASDAEMSKLREFQVREIGRFLGIPAPLLGENVSQWGSGVESLARFFWKFAGRQHMTRLMDPLSLRLLPPGQKLEINDTELLRGDTDALTKLVTATQGDAQRQPVLSRRELRLLLGWDSEFPADEETRMKKGQNGGAPVALNFSLATTAEAVQDSDNRGHGND